MRGIDILMTHEAARPFVIVDEPREGRKPIRRDAGKPAINDVLASMKPRLHLCGHHHRFVETVREGVPSVCIDRVNRSYLLIDAETLDTARLTSRAGAADACCRARPTGREIHEAVS